MEYVIRLVSDTKDGYYHSQKRWQVVSREEAEVLSASAARLIREKFRDKRLGYRAIIERK